MAITGAIRGTSKEELHNELSLETLEKEDVTENCVAFLRFSDTNVQSTYLILFPLLWVHTTQEILIKEYEYIQHKKY